METEVGRFRGVFDNGYSWDKNTALNLFYNFLMPNILTGGGYTKQKIAKKGIIAWATTKEDWNRRVPNFDINTFDTINQEALDILLNTSLGDLNNNRYYQDEDGEKVEQSFDKPEITRINSKTGEPETIKLQYGKNLTNKPSLQIETDKQNFYWELREEIKIAKINRDKIRNELKTAKPELTEKWEEDLKDSISVLEELSEKLKTTRKNAFNDDITLRQVIENDPKVEQFFSVIELSGEGLTDRQKVALGILREVTISNEARSKAEYEQMYDAKLLPYEEFKEMVERKEREYIKVLGLPMIISNNFAQFSDKTIDVELRLQDLLINTRKSDDIFSKNFLDVIKEIDYPLTIGETTYDNSLEVTKFIKSKINTESDKNELVTFIEFLVKRWYSNNVQPFLNQQAEFTITETTLEKPDGKDTPIRISKENLIQYVTDWEGGRLISDNAFNIAAGAETTQNKLKINLDFKDILVSMESALAAEVGATSTDVISQVKEQSVKKGDIDINYIINLKNDEEIQQSLPLLEAQSIFKKVSPILSKYGMRTKTSPDDAAKNAARKFLTRGNFNAIIEFMEIIKDLKDAEDEDLGKSLLGSKIEKRLRNFNTKLFFNGNNFKYDYLEFIDKLTNRRTQIGKNILNEMENLSLLSGFLTNFIEDNMTLLQKMEEQDFEDLSELSEDDRKERVAQLERESMRTIASDQQRQEMLEESELATEQEEAGQDSEEGRNLIGSMVEESGEEMEFQEKIENNARVLESIIGIMQDKDEFDKAAADMSRLKNIIDSAVRASQEKINTPDFKKTLKRFAKIVKNNVVRKNDFDNTTEKLIEMVKNIKGDEVDEVTRIAIKRYKEDITNIWNSILKDKDNKLMDEERLLMLPSILKLEEGIAEDMLRDKSFNDGRLGKITLSSKKLILSLDYINRQAQLKGKISWKSQGTSTISYKIQGGKAPKYTGALGETQSQRKLRNKRMTYSGKEQDVSFKANPVDELRYEFYLEVKKNIQVLVGVIK